MTDTQRKESRQHVRTHLAHRPNTQIPESSQGLHSTATERDGGAEQPSSKTESSFGLGASKEIGPPPLLLQKAVQGHAVSG